ATRLKEDQAHRLELQEQRCLRAQQDAKGTEERLQQSQKEYAKLWEEFNDFKLKRISENQPQHVAQLETLRAQHESTVMMITERYERRLTEVSTASQQKIEELQRENVRLREQLSHRKGSAHDRTHLEAEVREVRRENNRLLQLLAASS